MVHVWKSDALRQFVQLPDITPTAGLFRIALSGSSVYSLTTTTGQQGHARDPARQGIPIPLPAGFRAFYSSGSTPRYFADQKGTFEVWDEPGHGKCLKQIVAQQGHMWEYATEVRKPYTVIGDHGWRDYVLSADVRIAGGDVQVGGRFNDQNKLSYRLSLAKDGGWRLD